jgi:hypothetical protein
MTGHPFVPGRELARRFYTEAVLPIMDRHASGLLWGAALIGPGSEVLGFDTVRSMDHDWGPRLTIFLRHSDLDAWRPHLDEAFLRDVPDRVGGYATRFREFAEDPGVMHMAGSEDGEGELVHRVRITSMTAYLRETIGISSIDEMDVATWLAVPEQVLLEMTAGEVFRDDTRELEKMRTALAWYPDDIWRYRLAAAWKRIAQIEPFIGRAGEVEDDLGSQVIAMDIARDVMRLALLQERRYAPYAKWLGTAFARLEIAPALMPHLDLARFARTWQERERGAVEATSILAERHNALGLSGWVDPTPRQFFDRPFTVIDAERFADALAGAISDPAVRSLPSMLGGIDQYVDSTDALVNPAFRQMVRFWLRKEIRDP